MTSSVTSYCGDGNMIGIVDIITPMLYLLCKVSSSLPAGCRVLDPFQFA